MRHRAIAVLTLVLSARGLAAQPADTIHTSKTKLFGVRDLIVAGSFAAATLALHPLDRHFAQRFQDPTAQENTFLRGTAIGVRNIAVPGAMIIGTGMYAVGRIAHISKAADLGLHGTEALIIGGQLANVLKMAVGRTRPYNDITAPGDYQLWRGFKSDTYRSFPSGHAVAGFAAASAVTAETGRWWPKSTWYIGPVMYGGATLVALSRMYDNKHWASDVIVGAAIGTFSGQKVVQWHHSHPGNKIDKWLLHASLVPDGRGGTLAALAFPLSLQK